MTTRPLSRTEMKILVFNKVRRGMPYSEACRQVSAEMAQLRATKEKAKGQTEEKKPCFKESFTALTRRESK